MHTTQRLLVALFALLLVPFASEAAHAGKKAGVSMPNSVTVAGKKLTLNGMGLREATVFNVDVYVAGLYLETKSKDGKSILASDQAKRIHLVFKRDVDRDEMLDALNSAFSKNAGAKKNELKPHMKRFAGWLQNLKEGHSMTLTHVPGEGLSVAFDNKTKGTVQSDEFARVIFAGWLGNKVGDKDLRNQLLGR
ncbi:chalcone isomerase family protein [Haliangium ochraceum]|uniref:Chalcone isomerase, subgroup n=1 Tax=Haliangium ochraceum (strain DSM 14365 / JCM 11303 / SMP-2) TaxID=502025 RepID=D0LKL9_HALO1|nr:chalcone isomerase family protein [Haliangium ochraceum]ACY15067.1 Chalcone isomerase, subgroup [Haliangium ochraceum DSM 14365]